MKQPSEKQLNFLEFVKTLKVEFPEPEKKELVKKVVHKKGERELWKVFLDGASRGNPGPSGAGVYMVDQQHNDLFRQGFYLGNDKTNNQAEYLALVFALFFIKNDLLKKREHQPMITFISDSELLIKQMNGLYRVKNPILAQMKGVIDRMLEGIDYKFKHVLREYNVVADALANEGVDKKRKLPLKLLKFSSENSLV